MGKFDGGEGGIRTHGPGINRDSRLAGDPDQPLQHLSAYESESEAILSFFRTELKYRLDGISCCVGLAEGEGFEPPSRLPGKRFSRPPP